MVRRLPPALLALSPLLIAYLLGGCGAAYTQLGYEVTRSAAGTVSSAVSDPDAPSGSLAVGVGRHAVSLEAVVHGQEVAMADAPLVAASLGMELKVRPVRFGPVAAFVHGGPQRAALVDRATLDVTWGAGYSYGGGLTVGKGGVALVLDGRADEILYAGPAGGPTQGRASLKTLSIGLQLGR